MALTGRHAICVPTLEGHTYIFNSRTFASGGSFATTRGGCVAAVSPDHKKILPVLSAEETAAYPIPEQPRPFYLAGRRKCHRLRTRNEPRFHWR